MTPSKDDAKTLLTEEAMKKIFYPVEGEASVAIVDTLTPLLDRLDYKLDLVLRHNKELMQENADLKQKLADIQRERDVISIVGEPIQLQLPFES